MELTTINYAGIDLDVYYTLDTTKDIYGTGDSPTVSTMHIESVELTDNATNLIHLVENDLHRIFEKKVWEKIT